MENFNKNWLAILLIAVIFSTLGFLVGRTTGQSKPHRMMQLHDSDMDKLDIQVEVNEDSNAEVKVDTIIKDGNQITIKKIKKIEK